jgi:hypothetical protein
MSIQTSKITKALDSRCSFILKNARQLAVSLKKVLFYDEELKCQLVKYADYVCVYLVRVRDEQNFVQQIHGLRDARINVREIQDRIVTAANSGRLDVRTCELFYRLYNQMVDDMTIMLTEITTGSHRLCV